MLAGTLLATPAVADAGPAIRDDTANANPANANAAANTAANTANTAGDTAAADTARQPVEALRLDCRASVTSPTDRITDHAVEYGVACRWSVPTVDTAAGVRLLRIIVGSDQPRTTVFATRDLGENTHLDAPVRPNRRYAYRVQALSRSGRVVASSRTVTVAVRSIDVEPLRLECRAAQGDPGDTRVRTGCRWSLPESTDARVLSLWRSVDGAARELVASFDAPFDSSYRDVVPAGTTRVVYAVIATARDGSIVARSRAEVVTIDDADRPSAEMVAGPAAPRIGELDRATRIDRKGTAD